MPYIISQSFFPPDKADEVGKKYLELLKKYPQDESPGKILIPAAIAANKNGIMSLAATEVDKEKAFDSFNRATNMMIESRSIEGFRYEIRVWLTAEEALTTIGLG